MSRATEHSELLQELFKQEYARMTAVLCRHLGLRHMEIAEDIVSDAFLKASEFWRVHGLPDKPAAWLYTVAKNKAKDYLKRQALFEKRVQGMLVNEVCFVEELDFTPNIISDSQLAMIFAVCDSSNSNASQICLALQILCGFSLQEIANAFLTNTETIKKRLLRARSNLRDSNFSIASLPDDLIAARLETVLRTIYLLFNEGYHVLRKDLCSEAIRLGLLLTQHPLTNTTNTNALLALMCFQSSRLDARVDLVLFDEQDRNLWSQELIDKGNYFLVNACSGDAVSKYHLEAGIAYWHTTPAQPDKWKHILHLYNQLVVIEYSPVTALNRSFAFARVHGPQAGIAEAEKLALTKHTAYHALLGHLYAHINTSKAVSHYERAIQLSQRASEKNTLAKELAQILSSFHFFKP